MNKVTACRHHQFAIKKACRASTVHASRANNRPRRFRLPFLSAETSLGSVKLNRRAPWRMPEA